MIFNVTVVLRVRGLKNEREATGFAHNVSEHIFETFNDDNSIHETVHYSVERVQKKERAS